MGSPASSVLDSPGASAPSSEIPPSPKTVGPAEARWTLALTLSERLDLWREAVAEGERPPVDEESAAKRLASLRQQKPFDQPELWQERLDRAGATEDEVRSVLGLDPEWTEARAERPSWVEELALAYGGPAREPFPWSADANVGRCPFLPLVEPLVHIAYGRLLEDVRGILERFPRAPFTAESAARSVAASLPDLLATMLHRPMVVELHVAKLEERLRGETPAERFENFLQDLRDPENALAVLAQYPVLARRLVERLELWRAAGAEFLTHLAEDAPDLSAELADGAELGFLESAEGAVSDPHRGGRGVFLLRFDSGFRTVYKPKPMGVEVAFQELQGWINDKGFEPSLRLLRVLDRGDHGFMEWVDAAPCDDLEALSRFYRRQGAYLALFYVLEATDFHQENLIAAGEHPVPVDLETLMQPWVLGPSLEDQDSLPGSSLRSSLLRSNLLPEKWWGDGEHGGVDLSGLASREGQMTPSPVLTTTGVGTDEMRVERRRVEIPVADNRPRLAGTAEISLLDHRQDLERGFTELYDLLLEHRDELLEPGGPLDAFGDAEIRILFRQTSAYGTLLLESFHPHVLSNGLARGRLFDRLWAMSRIRPFQRRLIPLEVRDLERGDVPLFAARGGSRDVESWDGTVLEDFLGESGLDRVRHRLRSLGPGDRDRQLTVLRDSLQALRLGTEAQPRPSFRPPRDGAPPSSDELLAEASKIARRVAERAFRGPDETLWLTLHHGEAEGWHLAPTGPDVFQGLPGIALALGYLGNVLGDDELTDLARGALEGQRRMIGADESLVHGLGGFNGWGGIVYALTHLGVLWRDPSLLDEAESYAARLPEKVAEDPHFDWIAGSAGCAVALLGLDRVRPSEDLRRTVIACGERLLAAAEPQELGGVGWPMVLAGGRALAGFSHGVAGIALALLKVAELTGDDRFRRTALDGLVYERALFAPEQQNWPDLRAGAADDVHGGDHFMQAWCHGAPGIGLARTAGLPYLDDEEVRREIDTAVRSTLDQGFGQNHCLCHGDVGNLELPFAAGRRLGREEWTDAARRRSAGVLRSIEQHGLLFGLPGSIETPGLMTGLSGVAYGLARLAEPERLPSILTLDPVPGSEEKVREKQV